MKLEDSRDDVPSEEVMSTSMHVVYSSCFPSGSPTVPAAVGQSQTQYKVYG